MIHAVRIKDSKASYANRYVHTKKLDTERRYGYPVYLKVRQTVHSVHGLWPALQVDTACCAAVCNAACNVLLHHARANAVCIMADL